VSLATAGLDYLLGAPEFIQVGALTIFDFVLYVLVVGEELGWRGYALRLLLEKGHRERHRLHHHCYIGSAAALDVQ
jgi:hypothetical protein